MSQFKFIVILICLVSSLFVAEVQAAHQYDIKQVTPEIHQAFQNRKARYGELSNLKAQGAVGENNRGYAEVLNNPAQSTAVVEAENADRRVIYNAIVQQNGLGPGGLSTVEGVFAEVRRNKAKPGDSIQQPSGGWSKK